MPQNISEREFEAFCTRRGIPFERIPEASTKTPDYELLLGSARIVVEIKETEPNAEERESDRLLAARGYGTAIGSTPGDRVRQMIRSCSAQLKAYSKGVDPTLLVVFDRGRVAGHVESYQIRVAMYGLEQIHVAVPPIGLGRPRAMGISHGPKRKMTASDNTSISAIGALVMTGPCSHRLLVYRNAFARVPLSPSVLLPFGVKHYDIAPSTDGSASEWVEVASDTESLGPVPAVQGDQRHAVRTNDRFGRDAGRSRLSNCGRHLE